MRRALIACMILSAVSVCASANEPLPAALTPPAGSVAIGRYTAAGDQIYTCARKEGAAAWTLKGPDASLTGADGKALIRHFAGPTWQAADGSKVTGTLVAQIPAPAAGAIPWLLLRTTASATGTLGGTRFVLRFDTKGGAAPSGGCTSGADLRVPYSATYTFWR